MKSYFLCLAAGLPIWISALAHPPIFISVALILTSVVILFIHLEKAEQFIQATAERFILRNGHVPAGTVRRKSVPVARALWIPLIVSIVPLVIAFGVSFGN